MNSTRLVVKTHLGFKGKDFVEAVLLQGTEGQNNQDQGTVIAVAEWEKDGYYFVRKIKRMQENPKKVLKKKFRLPSYSLLYAFMVQQLQEFAGVNDLSQLESVTWKTVTAAKKSQDVEAQVTEKDHFSFPSAWTEPLSYVTHRARHVQRTALEDETFMKNIQILNFIHQGGKRGRSLNSLSKFLKKDKKSTKELLARLIKKKYVRQDDRGWYHVLRTPRSIDDLHLLHQDLVYIYKDPHLRVAFGVLLGALTAEMYWTWWPRGQQVLQTQYDGKGNIVSETLIDTPFDDLDFERIARELAEQSMNVAYLVDDGSKDPQLFVTEDKLQQSIDVAVTSIEFHHGVMTLYSVISRPIFAGVKCTNCNLHFVVFPYPEEITRAIMGEDVAYKHVNPEIPAFTSESLEMDNVECLCGTKNPELLQRPLHAAVPEPLEAAVEEAHLKYDEFLRNADLEMLQKIAEFHRPFLHVASSTEKITPSPS